MDYFTKLGSLFNKQYTYEQHDHDRMYYHSIADHTDISEKYFIHMKLKNQKNMKTEKFNIDKDLNLFGVKAESFPDGIQDSFRKLHSEFPNARTRNNYGISYNDENGNIEYIAAVDEQNPGEAGTQYEKIIIPKGEYISIPISDYMSKIPEIKTAFEKLMQEPGIDKNGYCVEIYESEKEMRCMIKLNSKK